MIMTFLKPILFGAALGLGACSGMPDLYPVTPPAVTQTQKIAFRSVEVRNVSLPTYASASEIAVEDASGKLISSSAVQWADSPERAVALELSRHLARLSGARVASATASGTASSRSRAGVRRRAS